LEYQLKVAILGAGVSGLTAARRLLDLGIDVIVYEAESTVGGLARSRIIKGYVYDPHGGHIFNSKQQNILDWVFSMLPRENWKHNVRNAKIFYNGSFISYPFELSLCELPIDDAIDCALGFILAQQGDEPDNFADWLIWNFGKSIADMYMLPYNRKIWAYPLEKMGVTWMRGKIPLPDKKDIIRSLALKDPSERKMPHSTYYYPIEGGIQTMIDAIAKPLSIRTSTPVESIEYECGKYRVNGDLYDNIVSTIPLPVLPNIMKLPESVCKAISSLKYNSLTTVLVDFPNTDISWLYIPSSEYRSHRVGYQSVLTPKATPDGGGSGAFEIIGERFEVDDKLPQTALPNELQPGHIIDTQFTEFAYVIHDFDYVKNVTLIREYFNDTNGFYITGRWGTWNYNNMDMCMAESFAIVDKILGVNK
jgi:protoporphyrinogen oxidase